MQPLLCTRTINECSRVSHIVIGHFRNQARSDAVVVKQQQVLLYDILAHASLIPVFRQPLAARAVCVDVLASLSHTDKGLDCLVVLDQHYVLTILRFDIGLSRFTRVYFRQCAVPNELRFWRKGATLSSPQPLVATHAHANVLAFALQENLELQYFDTAAPTPLGLRQTHTGFWTASLPASKQTDAVASIQCICFMHYTDNSCQQPDLAVLIQRKDLQTREASSHLQIIRCEHGSCLAVCSDDTLPAAAALSEPQMFAVPSLGAVVAIASGRVVHVLEYANGCWSGRRILCNVQRPSFGPTHDAAQEIYLPDDSEVTAWAWESSSALSIEQNFSALTTADHPSNAQQQQVPCLVLCKASGLVWRIVFAHRKWDGSVWSGYAQPFTVPAEAPVTCCTSLCSGAVLLITNEQPGLAVAFPPYSPSPRGNYRTLTALQVLDDQALPCAGPLADIEMGDVHSLGQSQVFLAHGRGRQGSVQLLHSGVVLEELNSASAPCQGMYNMWPVVMQDLASGAADRAHTFIILSFVTGTRVLSAAGGTLADATEEAGVEANAQTLAAGAMGPVHLLQALADRLLLCCLEPLLPAASGQPAAPHKARRRDDSFSSNDDSTSRTDGYGRPQADSPGISSPMHSHPEEAALAAGVEDAWQPPAGASIGVAAVCLHMALVSTAPNRSLIAVQLGPEQESPTSPGKRKRSGSRMRLLTAASVALTDEVSCLHISPSGNAQQAWLCLIGSYRPAVELWLLAPSPAAASATGLSFLQLGCIDVGHTAPLREHLPDPLGLADTLQASHHVPESLVLAQQPSEAAGSLQVLAGLRSSIMLHLTFPLHTTTDPPTLDHASASPQILSRQKLGSSVPLSLVPLPGGLTFQALAISDRPWLLRVSGGSRGVVASPLAATHVAHAAPWLMPDPADGSAKCLLLTASADGALHLMDLPAAPGRFQASFPLDATPKKLALSYRPHSLVVICNTVENEGPLSNPLRGNESSARMGQDSDEEQVSPSTQLGQPQVCDRGDPFVRLTPACTPNPRGAVPQGWRSLNRCQDELRCLEPVSGAEQGSYPLQPGECGTCLCLDQGSYDAAAAAASSASAAGSFMQPGQVDSTRSAAESERAGAGEQLAEAAMDSSSGGSSSQSDDSSSTSSGSWQAPDAALPGQAAYTLAAVGTRVGSEDNDWAMEEERPAGRWGGRLLLFLLWQLPRPASPGIDAVGAGEAGGKLRLHAEREFSSGVHAVCWLSPRVLVASVGQRLVAYALLGSAPPGRLRRLRNTACSRTVTCLTASSSCPGTFAASDAEHGTWIYRFDIRTGFEVLHADAIGSRISSCLPLHLPGSGQAQQPAGSLALEAAGKLVLSRGTQREPERNMYTQAHCSFGAPACALLPGGTSFRAGSLDFMPSSPASTSAPDHASFREAAHTWTAATTWGSVHAVHCLPAPVYRLLAAVQTALLRHPATQPLLAAEGEGEAAVNVVDGDLLAQLPGLPQQLQAEVLQSVDVASSNSDAMLVEGRSPGADLERMRYIVEVVQEALNAAV